MANVVEVIVKVRDNASGPLAAIGMAFKGVGAMVAGSSLLAMAGPLAAGTLALGAFAAVAAPSLDKVKKALTSTGAAGTTAWAALDPAQRNLATDIQGLQHQFDGLASSMAPVVARVGDIAVKTAGALLPALSGLATAGGSVITGVLTPLKNLFQSDFFGRFVTGMSQLATQFGPMLGKSLAELLKALMTLFMQAGPAGEKMLGTLLPLIARLITGMTPAVAAIAGVTAAFLKWAAARPIVVAALAAIGLAVAFATGGLSAIIPAMLALVGAITLLWQHSLRFRVDFASVWSDIAGEVLINVQIIIGGIRSIADSLLSVVGAIVHGAAIAFGWIPGIGGKLKTAAAAFDGFRSSVDGVFDEVSGKVDGWQQKLANMPKTVKIQGDISDLQAKLNAAETALRDPHLTATRKARIEADISDLLNKIAEAKAQLAALNGATATTYVRSVNIGGVPPQLAHHASGGIVGGSGWTWVGEQGPEVVRLPAGSQVTPAGQSRAMAAASGGGGNGGARVEVLLSFSGSEHPVIQALMQGLRAEIKTVGGGGPNSVQRTLGQSWAMG